MSSDGRRSSQAVADDRPDPITELDAHWHRLASGAGILGGDGAFLIDVGLRRSTPRIQRAGMTKHPQGTPAQAVTGMVEHVLGPAATWTAWGGEPARVDGRMYTPHKAIRRAADHLVDHLAELEARIVGEDPQPDRWHASASTTVADLVPFTQEGLDEARSRLVRLVRVRVQPPRRAHGGSARPVTR